MVANYYDSTPLVECDISLTKELFIKGNLMLGRWQRFAKNWVPLILLLTVAFLPLYLCILDYGIDEYIYLFVFLNVFLPAVLVLSFQLLSKELRERLALMYDSAAGVYEKERIRLFKYTYQRENRFQRGEFYWSEALGCVETKELFIINEKNDAPPFIIPKDSLTEEQKEAVKKLLRGVYARKYRYINR